MVEKEVGAINVSIFVYAALPYRPISKASLYSTITLELDDYSITAIRRPWTMGRIRYSVQTSV